MQEQGIDMAFVNWRGYNLGHAIFLIVLMILYAVSLRPIGFLVSASLFLAVGGYVPGERKLYDPSAALILLAGVYYGAIFGGSTSSILINAPSVALLFHSA